MHDREHVFLRGGLTVREEADLLSRQFGLEPIPHQAGAGADEIGLRGPARTTDGVIGYEVQPNVYPVDDPAPDEVQAIDDYPVEIAIWLGRDDEAQRTEGWLVFEQLVGSRPQVPMLLCHAISELVAAYLPGRGTHRFPDGTTIDAVHRDRWQEWTRP